MLTFRVFAVNDSFLLHPAACLCQRKALQGVNLFHAGHSKPKKPLNAGFSAGNQRFF